MINEFKSLLVKRGGLSRTNRFDSIINIPPRIITGGDRGRDLTLLCESASLPGKQITTLEWSLYGSNIKIPTGYIYDDVTMVFNITNDYYVKNIFDEWQNLVISDETYNLSYNTEFKTDILIRQLDEVDKPIHVTKLFNAYPITVQTITLDNNSESTVQKLSVVFSYEYSKKV